MKDLVRRPYVPKHADPSIVEGAFESSIFPAWFWERTQKNGLFYRMGYSLLSSTRDVAHEQFLMLSKFSYDFLDITKPFYAKQISQFESNFPVGTRFSQNLDVLYDDVYRIGRKIDDLGQEILTSLEQVRTLVQEEKLEIVREEDIDNVAIERLPFNIVRNELEEGEVLLSGEIFTTTSNGRTISFGDIEGTPPGVIDQGDTVEATVTSDGRYVLLNPLAVENSITVINTETGNPTDTVAEVIGVIEEQGRYNSLYDIDGDGYISSEDIQFIRAAIGTNVGSVPAAEWRNTYQKFDKDRNGRITESDVRAAFASEGAIYQTSLLVRNPIDGPVTINYEYNETPYTTYFSDSDPVRGGAPDALLPTDVDVRIKDGRYTSEAGITVGINIERNEIWAGRRTLFRWALSRVARPEPDRLLVRGMTSVDDVVFVLVSAEDNIPSLDGPVPGVTIALVRIDTLREGIEYTEDIIPISGIQLEEDETPTGLVSTRRKDRFRILTDLGNIYTVEMGWNSVSRRVNTVLISQDIPLEPEGITRIFNDLDNFAFNLGITRNPGENNDLLYTRVRESIEYPAGNDIQGIHTGTSRELSTYVPILSKPATIMVFNEPVPESLVIRVQSLFGDQFLSLGDVTSEEFTETDRNFLDDTVRTFIVTDNAYTKHMYENGSYVIGNTLVLSREFLRDLLVQYIRRNPASVTEVPNLDERLVQVRELEIEVVYDAIDPDGVLHPQLSERYRIDLPCIDQLEAYIGTDNSENKILPVHPKSSLAKEVVSYYALVEEDIDSYLGKQRVDEIIEDLKENDTSTWDKTTIDLSFFDERYRSDFIIRKTEFDDNKFDDEIIEVDL